MHINKYLFSCILTHKQPLRHTGFIKNQIAQGLINIILMRCQRRGLRVREGKMNG